VFKEARRAGLTTGFVSNGNGTPEVIEYLRPWVDLYKVDLKSFDDRHYRQLGGRLEPILDTIRRLHAMAFWVEIVTLLIPGFNDSRDELQRLTAFVASVSPDIPWHVTAFHGDYKMTDPGNTTAEMLLIPFRTLPLPTKPIALLDPFRIANQYGLFAVMTNGRYEIEFQGSNDGRNWTPYLFRNKPQALNEPPRIYAPYQPRFDWNLWFASLGDWHQNEIVPLTEERLLENDKAVLDLFRSNPFSQAPPRYVRAVLWQYWFTSREEKRATGNWWRRELLGMYAPELTKTPEGRPAVVQWPEELPVHD